MSAIAIIVLAVVAIWLVGMLVAGVRTSRRARARAHLGESSRHRSHAEQSRTEAAVRRS
jgi:FtsZ-interacting cell division protein ZipA